MRDIVFNISVQTLGQRPYKSIVEQEYLSGKRTTTALRTSSKELGILINPSGQIYGLPLIGSHVGADTAAALSAMDMFNKSNFSMLMDVGTNTEIVAKLESTIIAASCPAGPASPSRRWTTGRGRWPVRSAPQHDVVCRRRQRCPRRRFTRSSSSASTPASSSSMFCFLPTGGGGPL